MLRRPATIEESFALGISRCDSGASLFGRGQEQSSIS
jgi:hypothetical protein